MAPSKKILLAVAKYAISLGILAYLGYTAWHDPDFVEMLGRPKNHALLAAAAAVGLLAVVVTFVRWWMLVRALGIPFSLAEALRLGFIGYLFNFLTLGVVGGDIIKAVFIARERPGKRVEAIGTVIVDRVMGLYALFVVASAAFWFVDFADLAASRPAEHAALAQMRWVASACTLGGAVALALLLTPGFAASPLWEALARLPKVGPHVERGMRAARLFRRHPLFPVTLLLSFVVHMLISVCIYFTAQGLTDNRVSLGAHFVIGPVAMLAGSAPLPGGLGATEYALDLLYRCVSPVDTPPRQGFVIALGYRVITLLIAAIGMAYYLSSRQQVDQLVQEAEAAGDEPPPAAEIPPEGAAELRGASGAPGEARGLPVEGAPGVLS